MVTNDDQLATHRAVVPRLGPGLLLRRRREQHLRHAVQPAVRDAAAWVRPQVRLQPHRLQPEGDGHAGGDRLRAAGEAGRVHRRAPRQLRSAHGRPAARTKTGCCCRGRRRTRNRPGSDSSSPCARTPASPARIWSDSSRPIAWKPATCLPATSSAIPAFQAIPHRIVRDLANTDTVMNNTFFVGVYPGLDSARLDHMAVGVRQVHERGARDGAGSRERMPVTQKLDCVVERVVDSRRARLYAGAAARAAGAAVSGRPVSAPGPRSVRPDRLLARVARVLDRQSAGAAGHGPDHLRRARPVHGAHGERARRGPRGLDQDALRRLRRSTAAPDVVLFAGGTGITAFTAFLEDLTPDESRSR